MRIIVLSLILFCCGTCPITAQSDYIVTTPSTQEIPVGEEEQFIKNNFPLQPLCKWTPGMKFMFVPSYSFQLRHRQRNRQQPAEAQDSHFHGNRREGSKYINRDQLFHSLRIRM